MPPFASSSLKENDEGLPTFLSDCLYLIFDHGVSHQKSVVTVLIDSGPMPTSLGVAKRSRVKIQFLPDFVRFLEAAHFVSKNGVGDDVLVYVPVLDAGDIDELHVVVHHLLETAIVVDHLFPSVTS